MVSSVQGEDGSMHSNGSVHNSNGAEEKLDEFRSLLGKSDGDLLKIVSVGAGAWGSVFAALLQDVYGQFREKVQIRIWRRPGRSVDRSTAEHLFEVINSREDVLRRLIRRCAYLKYVEGRLGDRILYADEILKDGFCLNMIETPLCPLKVVTNLQEAVWDADIVINGLPSTETREVFEEISRYWKERITVPIIISLAKGIEAALDPIPRIVTPTQMIQCATRVPVENILYLGGPNIASEIYNKEYANARICGAEKWRKPLAKFLRQPHFIVWDNSDLVTHEVMGGLKNVYAIGAVQFQHVDRGANRVADHCARTALTGDFVWESRTGADATFLGLVAEDFRGLGGMVASLTNESATSKSVYFAHCTSEMIFITHLLAENPEKLAGPLLADTYVTLLKGRNAWYGQMLAKGDLSPDMGDSIKGKGMIQGVSAVGAFYELLSQPSLNVLHPDQNKPVAPVELCPILKTLYKILIKREVSVQAILQALRDETMNDPRERIEMAQSHAFYRPSLLSKP
ncbi:putative glycerol-3-phosphate dehydrogenase [NAD(+)] 1, cytosolic [Platanthera guangdongensis]|uniref:Glycerol-3-phosphate dehydrogenase [NAD(+)] n=1 Tax=Platanthera guangdongensis TaxID=2320717 RepID=A0ABR2LYH0_9ASPA